MVTKKSATAYADYAAAYAAAAADAAADAAEYTAAAAKISYSKQIENLLIEFIENN